MLSTGMLSPKNINDIKINHQSLEINSNKKITPARANSSDYRGS